MTTRSPLRATTGIGFVIRFLAIGLVMFAVPTLIGPTPTGLAHYLPVVAAAAIAIAGYLLWPQEMLLAFAFFMLFQDTFIRWMGVPIRQLDEITVPVIFLIAGSRVVRDWRSWWWWPREGSIAAAVGLGIVSSLAAHVPITVWVPAVGLMLKGIAFLYVAIWTGAPEWKLRAGVSAGLSIAAVVLLLAFVELANPLGFQRALNLHEYYHPRGTLPALKSLFYHPVLFAWFTAFVAIFAYADFAFTRRWRSFLLGLVFSLGPFLAARRRAIAALVGGLAAGIVSFAIRVRSLPAVIRSWSPVAAGLVVLLIVFLPGLVTLYGSAIDHYLPSAAPSVVTPTPGPTSPPVFSVEGDTNPQARVALYVGSLKVARDYFPLGAGLGRYGSWMSRIDYSPVYAAYGLDKVQGLRPRKPTNITDTFWPQILGELGVLGALAYAGFLASLGWLLWQSARRAEGWLRIFTLAAGSVFAQALVESLASPMFHSPARVYLVFLVVGLSISMLRPARDA